jgi:hypothetical protein
MFQVLSQLREWIIEEQGLLCALIPQFADQINVPDELPPASVWDGVSLADQYSTYTYVRRIRESWDLTLREHEDSWDSNGSFQKRASIVGFATALLNNCFINSEQREAREEAHAQQVRRRLLSMQQMLARTFTPPNMEQYATGEIDWDSMFQSQAEEDDGSGS